MVHQPLRGRRTRTEVITAESYLVGRGGKRDPDVEGRTRGRCGDGTASTFLPVICFGCRAVHVIMGLRFDGIFVDPLGFSVDLVVSSSFLFFSLGGGGG